MKNQLAETLGKALYEAEPEWTVDPFDPDDAGQPLEWGHPVLDHDAYERKAAAVEQALLNAMVAEADRYDRAHIMVHRHENGDITSTYDPSMTVSEWIEQYWLGGGKWDE